MIFKTCQVCEEIYKQLIDLPNPNIYLYSGNSLLWVFFIFFTIASRKWLCVVTQFEPKPLEVSSKNYGVILGTLLYIVVLICNHLQGRDWHFNTWRLGVLCSCSCHMLQFTVLLQLFLKCDYLRRISIFFFVSLDSFLCQDALPKTGR